MKFVANIIPDNATGHTSFFLAVGFFIYYYFFVSADVKGVQKLRFYFCFIL
jgi:hypothetical protein